MKKLLFLCTGNYYRSRFAEYFFRHLVTQKGLPWEADSRGLRLSTNNKGPLSHYTLEECERLGVPVNPLRDPSPVTIEDLEAADITIAVKRTEHQPMMQEGFPNWDSRVQYWEVHDIDVEPPEIALPIVRNHVEQLVESLDT